MIRTLILAATFVLGGTSMAVACDYAEKTATAATDAGEASVALASTTLRVEGVTCGGCLVPIREELTAIKGVKEVKSGEDVKDVIVVFADAPVADADLIAAIKKAGYTATKKEAPKQT